MARTETGSGRTANEEIRDRVVTDTVYAFLIGNEIRRRVLAELLEGMPSLEYFILKNFKGYEFPGNAGGAVGEIRGRIRRIDKKASQLRKLQEKQWERGEKVWWDSFRKAAVYEERNYIETVERVSPYKEDLRETPSEELYALLGLISIQGRTIEELLDKSKKNYFSRLESEIKYQLSLGVSADEIAAAVTNGKTGVLRKTAAELDTITSSSITGMLSTIHEEFSRRNPGIFGENVYWAILDNVTTDLCRSLHGTRHEIGKGPQPPLHYNCRSCLVPLFEFRGAELGDLKDFLRKDIESKFRKANKLGADFDLGDLSIPMTRELNAYVRERVLGTIGRTPADVTFGTWLRGIPKTAQRKVLGGKNYKKYREGRKTVIKFRGMKNRYVDIDNLKRREE